MEMNNPFITIIIPTYNNLFGLKECLASIESQTNKNYEVLIVDGNSSDGTKKYLETIHAPFYAISEKDEGIYDAMNKGINMAKGKWLYFLGSDDNLYNNDVIEKLYKSVNDDLMLVLGNIKYNCDQKDSVFIRRNNGIVFPSWSKLLWMMNTVHHQGTLFNRQVFDKHSYSKDYLILSDYALNIQLFKKRVKVKVVNEIFAHCGTIGISKKYNWNLYKEEIKIKTKESSIIYYPMFFCVSFCKFFMKKVL